MKVSALQVWTILEMYFYVVGPVIGLIWLGWVAIKRSGRSVIDNVRFVLMPALLVIGSITAAYIVIDTSLPKLEKGFTSEPVQAALDLGELAAMSIDYAIDSRGSGGSTNGSPVLPTMGENLVTSLYGAMSNAASTSNEETAASDTTEESDADAVEFVSASVTMKRTDNNEQTTILPGDSMGAIAKRYGVNLNELCAMNARTVPNCSVVRAGTVVELPKRADGSTPRELVPIARQVASNSPAPTRAPAVAQAVAQGAPTYTIKPNDNIFSIAKNTGVEVYKLCVLNIQVMGNNCETLTVGATLRLQ